MVQSDQRFSSTSGKFAPAKVPVLAVVLILLGDLFYFPWLFWLFFGFLSLGWLPAQAVVPFVSAIGLFLAVAMMFARPNLHIVWGILALGLTLIAT